ncbi:GP46-like surface antigen, putative [Bodo saltans]|uniref:GP46-like surface antigen, putative n=1 Tax=Bodo saltans TaxID=75058 RepID=A0A0S4IK14_BODSA|nr:GP46-like surface antigen, putative [Bodo saltans]|eukprot:CUE62105.1 GP46-like surface antigen, putative [Bodo saltans]
MTLQTLLVLILTQLLLSLCVLTSQCTAVGMCGCEHRYSLLMDLYNATNGAGWANNSGWSMTSALCNNGWYGVTCDGSDVTVVAFHNNNLAGTLPLSFWNLTNLTTLDFGVNALSGTLPLQLSSLTRLTALYLHANSFSGTLPLYWANMTQLMYLFVSYNSLSGTLPPEWSSMTQLRTLSLQGSRLSGTLPLEWGDMTQLSELYLYSNTFIGTLPPQWSRMAQLSVFYLHQNKLNGTLPPEWSNMTQLTSLQLYSNSLSGVLPSAWSKLTLLTDLQLSTNSLSGTLPPQWSNMTSLSGLTLHYNALSGTLPSEWSKMTQIAVLDLFAAGLVGTLPPEWSSMQKMSRLYLQQNLLNGTLPFQWSNMRLLSVMDVSYNAIHGTLPPEWSSMTLLTTLNLNSNRLSGHVPFQWRALTAIASCAVGMNCLSGMVPFTLRTTAVDTCGTKLRGGVNVTTCLGQSWPQFCSLSLYSASQTTSFSSSDAVTFSQTYTSSTSVSNSCTKSLTMLLSSSAVGSVSTSMSHEPDSLSSSSTRTVSSSQSRSASVSTWECITANDTITLSLQPLLQAVEQDDAVVLLSSSDRHILNVTRASLPILLFITLPPIARSVISTAPLLVFNVSFESALGAAAVKHWIIGNVTISDAQQEQVNTTVFTSNTVPWVAVVLHPPFFFFPKGGCCGSYSQVTSVLSGGVASGSSLARVMTVRSMVLCDADAAVSGGVIDLNLIICDPSVQGGSLVDARSAIVSNIVLVAAVTAILLLFAALCTRVSRVPYARSLRTFCLPSSLLPLFAMVVPSMTSSSVLLLARVNISACAGVDVVLAVVGLTVAALPCCGFLALLILNVRSGMWRCEQLRSLTDNDDDGIRSSLANPRYIRIMWRRASRRSHEWTSDKEVGGMESARVVLLEYCDLRYGALDSGCLVAVACLSVVSGLGGSEAQCRAWSFLAMLLLLAQLVLLVVLRPLTTVVSMVHSFVTLALTLLSVLSQLVFVWGYIADASGLWLVEASAVFSLAVVGVSAVKMALDLTALVFAVKRRLMPLCALLANAERPPHQEHSDVCVGINDTLLHQEMMMLAAPPQHTVESDTQLPLEEDFFVPLECDKEGAQLESYSPAATTAERGNDQLLHLYAYEDDLSSHSSTTLTRPKAAAADITWKEGEWKTVVEEIMERH